ncbi:MAG: hypothetical protein PHH54_01325 [Candidatus Nanoarchaeia archaeon]|nr:hypothetical protein [Candidatus Nanoarchaeia archaeon]MDD5740604.1 hypothetical protein [Candidatus Nanoarchaeia archaeon]
MEKIEVNPNEVGIWVGYIKPHKEPLENIIKIEGWKNIPPVPIFRLPEGYNHKFVLIDGHARRDAAIITNSLLPCILYAQGELINPAKDGLASFGYQDRCSDSNFYQKIVAMYLVYENAPLIKKSSILNTS